MQDKTVSASLSKQRQSVCVSGAPAKVLDALIQAGTKGLTSEEIRQRCEVSPSSAISRLRLQGANIDTYPAPHKVYRGSRYSGQTRYVYRGWDPEAFKGHATDATQW